MFTIYIVHDGKKIFDKRKRVECFGCLLETVEFPGSEAFLSQGLVSPEQQAKPRILQVGTKKSKGSCRVLVKGRGVNTGTRPLVCRGHSDDGEITSGSSLV